MPTIESEASTLYRYRALAYIVDQGLKPSYLTKVCKAIKSDIGAVHVMWLFAHQMIHFDRIPRGKDKNTRLDLVWYATEKGRNTLKKHEEDNGTISVKEQGKPGPKEFACEVCNYKGKHPNRETFQCPNCLSTYYKGKVHRKGRGY